MYRVVLIFASAVVLNVQGDPPLSRQCNVDASNQTIYDFTIPTLSGSKNISLSDYRGKLVLIVNVATYCGYAFQYQDMNYLSSNFSDDLEILGFPCNQFGGQEPGGNSEEIMNGISYVRPGKGFIPNFQLFRKIDVNGKNEHPLFSFLKESCPSVIDEFPPFGRITYQPVRTNDIRWNWEKILIDRNGKPVLRYYGGVKPQQIQPDIVNLVQAGRTTKQPPSTAGTPTTNATTTAAA